MMKKVLFSLFTALSLCVSSLSVPVSADGDAGKNLSVVATIFPEYDWVLNVLGDEAEHVDVTLLLDSGVDLHNYQPTASDILKIASCDLFICVGGESDDWVEDALEESVNPDMRVINLLDALGSRAKEEEIVEGMEEDHDHDHDDREYDEHVWLSLKNASALTSVIAETLAELDPSNADAYMSNAKAYEEAIDALDLKYAETLETASFKTVLFGDRFPFRYLTDDYGLDYYAAFAGCSAETEASFETIAFLSQKVRELGLPAVLTIEGTDHRIAETIAQNAGDSHPEILSLNSMQATTLADADQGASYLSIMEKNLEILSEALS